MRDGTCAAVSRRVRTLIVSAACVLLFACASAAEPAGPGSDDAAAPGVPDASHPPPPSGDAGVGVDAAHPHPVDAAVPPHDGAVPPVDAATPHDASPPPRVDAQGDAGLPAGWLYTQGNKIYVSTGGGNGTVWMGRGVNMDDIFFCGYDNTLWMQNPDQTLENVVSGLMSGWKPSFVRISLGMASYPTVVSWTSNPAQYKTPMTNVIDAIGSHVGTYVLVTLRSDSTMIGQDTVDGDPEATGLPSANTDAVYVALVDSFASSSFVLFGLTNEPGGNKLSNATISAAMSHAVGVIRAEEDRLGVPHHIVSVQGNGWTSDISFYAASPLAYDNVAYEVHGYPPSAASYTYSNIPVIIGEYGSLPDSAAFYADVEAKQIPNLAWDFESYSNCSPDLLNVNQSDTALSPTSWGTTVQSYLLSH
jgi:hypothetical protein